jgi:hypothetical protein
MNRWLPVLALLTLPVTAWAGTASVVANLKTEEAECSFLVGLCRTANRGAGYAAGTPRTSRTEVLATRNTMKADMQARDAIEAGEAIKAKHGGKKLKCFDDPECEFVRLKVFP